MPKTKKPVVAKKSKLPTKKEAFPVLSAAGEKIGSITLPKELFGLPFNAQLVAQAQRVYQINQMEGSAATKTRGMVEGSTRKIYRQKGTGRARHGGIRAPIFVGGGVALGPQPKDIQRTMPKQMKRKALLCALSLAVEKNAMKVVDGLSELPMKTKSFAEMLTKIQANNRILFVYGKDTSMVARAVRNIKNVSPLPFDSLSVYDVMNHASLVFTKDALASFIAKGTKA